MEQYVEKYFPGLIFVGEEDTSYIIEYGDKYKFLTDLDEIDLNLIPEETFDQNEYEFDQIKLFIDPIDATLEFIKKNYAVVTCLVGIVYKEEPICGFIHYPIQSGAVDENSVTYFNILNKGIYEYHTYTNKMEKITTPKKEHFAFCCSKAKKTPQIDKSK